MIKCKHLRLESTETKYKCLDCEKRGNKSSASGAKIVLTSHFFRYTDKGGYITEQYWPVGGDEIIFGEELTYKL